MSECVSEGGREGGRTAGALDGFALARRMMGESLCVLGGVDSQQVNCGYSVMSCASCGRVDLSCCTLSQLLSSRQC